MIPGFYFVLFSLVSKIFFHKYMYLHLVFIIFPSQVQYHHADWHCPYYLTILVWQSSLHPPVNVHVGCSQVLWPNQSLQHFGWSYTFCRIEHLSCPYECVVHMYILYCLVWGFDWNGCRLIGSFISLHFLPFQCWIAYQSYPRGLEQNFSVA